MPDPVTYTSASPPRAERVEVITSVQRRRRWATEERVRIVEETYLPGNSASIVARHFDQPPCGGPGGMLVHADRDGWGGWRSWLGLRSRP